MRLGRLDLIRFGAFTDHVLQFPEPMPGAPDLHVVVGANEAGKSTTLAAIEAVLFGIPQQSPHNFRHAYPDMRVGGRLEMPGQPPFELVRRKGRKDTVLDLAGTALPGGEAKVAALVGDLSLESVQRMVTLTAERLRQGGEEMLLNARDEVGQALFAAGSGMAGLHQMFKTLEEEADALWGPRRAAHRAHTRAEEALRSAEEAIRAHTLSERDWQAARKALDAAQAALATLETQAKDTQTALARVSRTRRVLRDLRTWQALEAQRATLPQAPRLPADAGARLDAALHEAALAAQSLETLAVQRAALQAERDALTPDARLLARADDITALAERRIARAADRDRLPALLHDIAVAEASVRRLSEDLGRPPEAPLPDRSDLKRARALLSRRGPLETSRANAATAWAEADERLAALARDEAALGPDHDSTALAAALAAVRAEEEVGALKTLAAEARTTASALARRLAPLDPGGGVAALAALRVPARDEVLVHRDAVRALEERRRDLEREGRDLSAERERLTGEARALTQTGGAVAPATLAEARAERDALWRRVKAHWRGDGSASADPELLAKALEVAQENADALADRRFEHAEAAARLARLEADQDRLEARARTHAAEVAALGQEAGRLEADWRTLCPEGAQPPRGPEALLDWLAERAAVLALAEQADAAAARLAVHEAHLQRLGEGLLTALSAVADVSGLAGQPVAMILEAARATLETLTRRRDDRQRLRRAQDEARQTLDRLAQTRTEAQTALADTEHTLRLLAEHLGLDPSTPAERLEHDLETLEHLLAAGETLRRQREEDWARLDAEAQAFETAAQALAAALAPDLPPADGQALALALAGRLAQARRDTDRRRDLDASLARLTAQHDQAEASRAHALAALEPLFQQAGVAVDNVAMLQEAIARSDTARAVESERAAVLERLRGDGDGLPLETLQAEAADADPDTLAAEEERLRQAFDDLDTALTTAREQHRDAARAFASLGGDDGAARAASDRAAALETLAQVTGAYLRARGATILLRWGLERFRRERQGPLLRRAGALFAILTEGSFTSLEVEFDDQDRASLHGQRPDGSRVGLEGLSAGTVDQLYLALRLASLELARAHGPGLPFIADDLFLTFDDRRAAAGFRVLAEVARSTQVLFFTHHTHLIEVATQALGVAPSLQVLGER
ncbi:YhaN family protein [Pararhodospirillum photometricum]|nr:YhaN family protein [Pararhodospirillum photometricum]